VVNERIAHNEVPIDDEAFAELLGRLSQIEPLLDERLTRFELLTVAALEHFSDVAVDVAVIEVGLGGTWDSTNVVQPRVSVLTNVALDHTQVLGETVEEIGRDKAGIIKRGAHVVLGEVPESVAEIVVAHSDEVGASALWQAGEAFAITANRLAFQGRVIDLVVGETTYRDLHVPLHGAHQGLNASVAVAAVTAFVGRPLSSEVVEAGLGRVAVPGRLEVLGHQPLVMVDAAHNPAGAAALGQSLEEGFDVTGPMVAVIGMLIGRDPAALLRPLAQAGISVVLSVEPDTPRALDRVEIAKVAAELGLEAHALATLDEALALARERAGLDGLVLATGSLYVVGPARAQLLKLVGRSLEGH
jgi:dihydrofolate synthase/folylpolyglutamate synthase